jgi:hypothetical protein
MSRIDQWLSENPDLSAPELACRLARDRFWKDEQQSLIRTHPEMPDAAYMLGLDEEVAHALLLVLSRLRASERQAFAQAFYEQRQGGSDFPVPRRYEGASRHRPTLDPEARVSLGAALVLQVLELIELPATSREQVVDLLRGAAQGDDLARAPATALERLSSAIAPIRPGTGESTDAQIVLAEVLTPSSGVVDLREVLARCAFTAVDSWEPHRVVDFLVDAERLIVAA